MTTPLLGPVTSNQNASNPVSKPRSAMNAVFNIFSSVAKSVFADEVEEKNLPKPPLPLFINFSNEIRMVQLTFGSVRKMEGEYRRQIYDFCNYLIKDARQVKMGQEYRMEKARELIGKVIFLADLEYQTLENIIKSPNPSEVYEKINTLFLTHLDNIRVNLEVAMEKNNLCGIQDGLAFFNNQLAVTISKILVSECGVLNVAIMPTVLEKLSNLETFGGSNIYDWSHLVQDLAGQRNVNEAFESLDVPKDNLVSQNIIRCVLGLSKDQEVTKTHAKQAGLAALLTNFPMQGLTWVKKKELQILACKYLYNYACILEFSSYTEKEQIKKFTFKNCIVDLHAYKEFKINRNGWINDTEIPFWELPGLHAAARQLGITFNESMAELACQKIFQNIKDEERSINIQKLIRMIAKIDCDKLSATEDFEIILDNLEGICEIATAAFTSETHNILSEIIPPEQLEIVSRTNNELIEKVRAVTKDRFQCAPVQIVPPACKPSEDKNLLECGKEICEMKIDNNTRVNIFEFAYFNMIPQEIRSDFQAAVQDLDKSLFGNTKVDQGTTIREYVFTILEIVKQFTEADEEQRFKYDRMLSNYLLTSGLDKSLIDYLKKYEMKINIGRFDYSPYGVNLYLVYDIVNMQMVRADINNDRSSVEILNNLEYNNVKNL